MTTTGTGASRKRGAPARSNSNGHIKTLKFHGVELQIPKKVPFRLVKAIKGGSEINVDEMVDAVTLVLGEEQMEKVWDIDVDISKGMDALGAFLFDLGAKVLDAADTSPGE